jgi:mRNA interferase RelE/StbE
VLISWSGKVSEFSSTGFSCLDCTYYPKPRLKKIDKAWQKRILDYLENTIAERENPRDFGKPLLGNFSGLWRYRVGDYRVICQINDQQLVILTAKISHRKDVYE